jgi:hypothetical protein
VNQCFRNTTCAGLLTLSILLCAGDVWAQKRSSKKKPPIPPPVNELTRLREEFIKATNEYKTSLEKLLTFYEADVKKAEEKLSVSKKLLAEGLIAKTQVEENEHAVSAAQAKVTETRRQMTGADDQIAGALLEADADAQIAKNLSLARQRLVRTSSFIRFIGGPGWNIGEAYKIQRFFSETYRKELPIAVFGQGNIHNRWRLDHRNAMDISLHPDTPEGQGLLNFLQRNGIPYLAFRGAIPGTATGPHIHIGKPSHRY